MAIDFKISIHSLRMEGDFWYAAFRYVPGRFQSTPSAWRETRIKTYPVTEGEISIHSLRMEGDTVQNNYYAGDMNFNPLPPHGGRLMNCPKCGSENVFQSTPSAWRETQSLYILYTGLCISIHSLRMEGDRRCIFCLRQGCYFTPRPPLGGRPIGVFK